MGRDELFGDLPETDAPRPDAAGGGPRLRAPERDQIELRVVDLDSVIGKDDPVRAIWAYVERLDLSELYARIKSREGRPGHPTIEPRLLVALWLYATSQGVGSARALARLCTSHDAYRWLCGGVSVNHHTLADFRVEQAELVERLLVENVAALASAGVIDLETLAQDGVKVRAAAGASSFRRRPTLVKSLKKAKRLVARLAREIKDHPDASNRRIALARARAAAERQARVEAALAKLAEIEAAAARRAAKAEAKKKRQAERKRQAAQTAKAPAQPSRKRQAEKTEKTKKTRAPRASTTDPEARVMKMADGGFRPAYNVQIASVPERQIVVAVDPVTSGSDRGLLRPMLEAVKRRYKKLPRRHLADAAYGKKADIEWAHQNGVLIHCPPLKNKHGTDPFAARPDDGPGVAAWRRRMKSPAGKGRFKHRALAECIHARCRQWNFHRLTVRGRAKVRAVMLWFALANNLLRTRALVPAA